MRRLLRLLRGWPTRVCLPIQAQSVREHALCVLKEDWELYQSRSALKLDVPLQ